MPCRRLLRLLLLATALAACGEPAPALPGDDAGLPDAALPEGPDAALSGADASEAARDAELPGPDAGEAGPDAAAPGPDAADPGPDAAAPGPDAGAPDIGPTVRVMTWNAENFFDDVDNPSKQDTVVTAEQYAAKTAALARVIRLQAPDVLALQEVENAAVLRRLADEAGLPHIALVPSYDYRGINVALASRLPIVSTVSHLGEKFYAPSGAGPYRWARDCLEVHLSGPDGRAFVLLVGHHTSQLDAAEGDNKRQAQARRTREIADGLRAAAATRPVIVAGDFNDDPTTASIGLLLAGGGHEDIATDVPAAERYTYVYNGPHRYDYLLPTPDLGARRASVTILHGPEVAAASDHAPVVATFRW